MTASFTSQMNSANALVSIASVDLADQTCVGYSAQSGNVNISFGLMTGGVYIVPAIGEQWVCRRSGRNSWQLLYQVPFQDERLNLEPVQGMTAIGRSGPTVLKGSSVDVQGPLRVNGAPLQEKVHRYRLVTGQGSRALAVNTYVTIPYAVRTGDGDGGYFELNKAGTPMGTVTCLRALRARFTSNVFLGNQVNSGTGFDMAVRVNGNSVAYKSQTNARANASMADNLATEPFDLIPGDLLTVQVMATVANQTLTDGTNYANQLTISYFA